MNNNDTQNNKTVAKYKLIPDEPVGGTKVGPHAPLAESISKQIKADENGNNPNNCIALYGKWGSGKSSVVRMLAKELDAELIEFDMWNYSGDMLRRSFLGKLIERIDIAKEKYNPETFSKDTKDGIELSKIISGKYQSITTKKSNEDHNTIIIKTIFVSLILSWLFVSNIFPKILSDYNGIFSFIITDFIVSFQLETLITNLSFLPIKFLFLIDFSFTAGIFYVILINTDILRNIVFFKTSINTESNITKTTSIQTQDMTENDFEKIYEIILKSVEDRSKTYLICIDNIDRMGVEHASSILDDLNVFLTESRKRKNIYLIVPVDDDALSNAVESHSSNNNSTNNNNSILDNNSSSTFIQKLFPISFRLTDMINFEWREFLIGKLKEAGIEGNILLDEIVYVFDRYRRITIDPKKSTINSNSTLGNLYEYFDIKTKPITPREIIYYVNKMVTTYSEMNSNVEIKYIAYYVAITQFNEKKDYTDMFSKIPSEEDFLTRYISRIDIIEKLYSIHYQTLIPYETLYKKEFTSSISKRDTDRLKKFREDIPKVIYNLFKNSYKYLGNNNVYNITSIKVGIESLYDKDMHSEIIKDLNIFEAIIIALQYITTKLNLSEENKKQFKYTSDIKTEISDFYDSVSFFEPYMTEEEKTKTYKDVEDLILIIIPNIKNSPIINHPFTEFNIAIFMDSLFYLIDDDKIESLKENMQLDDDFWIKKRLYQDYLSKRGGELLPPTETNLVNYILKYKIASPEKIISILKFCGLPNISNILFNKMSSYGPEYSVSLITEIESILPNEVDNFFNLLNNAIKENHIQKIWEALLNKDYEHYVKKLPPDWENNPNFNFVKHLKK